MKKITEEWLKISEYDLETAGAMLTTGRYLYVAFMCQQAVEKLLKSIYAEKKDELPPRIHNLSYLTDILELDVKEKDKLLLTQLNQFYLESRYPGERDRLAQEMDENKGRFYLDRTREVWKWLKEILH